MKRDANDRIREAFPEMQPSADHDYVDEIIGLLRVARMHITDAEDRCEKLFRENARLNTPVQIQPPPEHLPGP